MEYRVIKRDGSIQEFKLENIYKQVKLACEGLNCNPDMLVLNAKVLIRDMITSSEIQENLISSAEGLVDEAYPQWTFVAARLRLYDLYHKIELLYNVQGPGDVYKKVTLMKYIEENKTYLPEYFDKYTKEEIEELDSVIDGKRDLLFDNLGMKTCIRRYLNRKPVVPCSMKDVDEGKIDFEQAALLSKEASKHFTFNEKGELEIENVVIELPQHMHMCVAMFAAQNEKNKVEWAKKYYEYLSSLKMIAATPINTFSRTKNGSTASCFVATMEDNLNHIFDTYKELGLGSSQGGGFGVYVNNLRSLGSWINGRINASSGIVPNLKVSNDIAVYINQGGMRNGAFNAFIECWHLDIVDFISLRKKEGSEYRRAQDLFLSISFNDVFMERLELMRYNKLNDVPEEKEITWTLFDPYDVPRLKDRWGEEFRKEYLRYEEIFKSNPELFNYKTQTVPMKELVAVICKSYFEEGLPFPFFKDNCNRAHPHEKEFGMIRSSNLCMEFMNPTSQDEISVCNLGSLNIARLTSDEELAEASSLMTRFLDSLVDASNYKSEKAKKVQKSRRSIGIGILGEAERTANEKIYIGSQQHINFINEKYSIIRNAIDKTNKELAIEKGSCDIEGIRCAYQMCIAPNTTSGVFAGTTNSTEPVFEKVWIEKSKIGVIKLTAPNLSLDNYEFYQSAYYIDQKLLIDMTAERQKYVDMGISHSLFFDSEKYPNKKVPMGYIADLMVHAWKKGLKSLYYIRSKQPSKNNDNIVKNKNISCVGCEN